MLPPGEPPAKLDGAHVRVRSASPRLRGRVPACRDAADAILRETERLLGKPGAALPRVEVWLAEPAPPGAPAGGDGPVVVVASDEPDPAFAAALARAWVRERFGPDAAQADLLVEGVAGVAAARAGLGPSLARIREWAASAARDGSAAHSRMRASDGPNPARAAATPATPSTSRSACAASGPNRSRTHA
ncbi:MAG: hypothetical protein ACKOWF_13515, partial [Chloroflexota bacterium]